MPTPPGSIRQLWFKWKALRLPWRKKWLVGSDLSGNTFWEFKDALHAGRLRRIVEYSAKAHYADVKISPQWHQWLRHTRPQAPTIQEQHYEVQRQINMRQLAADADARWAAKPSFLDTPDKHQPRPAIGVKDDGAHIHGNQTEPIQDEAVRTAVADDKSDVAASVQGDTKHVGSFKKTPKHKPDNPWKQPSRGAPGEDWQPQTWSPGVAQRK